MSLFEPDEIDKILRDTERVKQLLALEKERRGVRPDDLVFIDFRERGLGSRGTENFAQICGG